MPERVHRAVDLPRVAGLRIEEPLHAIRDVRQQRIGADETAQNRRPAANTHSIGLPAMKNIEPHTIETSSVCPKSR